MLLSPNLGGSKWCGRSQGRGGSQLGTAIDPQDQPAALEHWQGPVAAHSGLALPLPSPWAQPPCWSV